MKSFYALCLLALVCGCGREPGEGAGEASAAGKAINAVNDAEDSVAAVLLSAAPAPMRLRFQVADKPVAGQPAKVHLKISAAEAMPVVLIAAEAQELEFDASASGQVALTEADVAASHVLQFTALRAGWSELTVRLRSGSDGSTEARYSIPVLVMDAAP